jgi:hypothetical protein
MTTDFSPGHLMVILHPIHIVDDRIGSGLDAAVVGVDSFTLGDFGVLEAVCLLLGCEHLDVLPQGAMVTLEGEDVVGLLIDDFLADVALAPHGVDGDDGTLDHQHIEKRRDGDDLVRTRFYITSLLWLAGQVAPAIRGHWMIEALHKGKTDDRGLTQGEDAVVPWIYFVSAPGHTPGHTAFHLTSESAELMISNDVAYVPALCARHPEWHGAFDQDGPIAEASRRKLLDRWLPVIC